MLTNGTRRTLTSTLILYILNTGLAHHQMRADLVYHRRLTVVAYLALLTLLSLLVWIVRPLLFLSWLNRIVSLSLGARAEFASALHSLLVELLTDVAVVVLDFGLTVWAGIGSDQEGINLLKVQRIFAFPAIDDAVVPLTAEAVPMRSQWFV